jgi:hypothetical protein
MDVVSSSGLAIPPPKNEKRKKSASGKLTEILAE